MKKPTKWRSRIAWILTGLFGLMIAPIIQQNVQGFASRRHWDALLVNEYPALFADLIWLTQTWWFAFALGMVAGGAITGWGFVLAPLDWDYRAFSIYGVNVWYNFFASPASLSAWLASNMAKTPLSPLERPDAPKKSSRSPTPNPALPFDTPKAEAARTTSRPRTFALAWSDQLAKDASAPAVYTEAWESPANWNVLFKFNNEDKTVRLRFLPDSKNVRADALLLILFAYKKMFGVDELSVDKADNALVGVRLSRAQNNIMLVAGLMQPDAALDIARDQLNHLVSIVKLSKGGYLSLSSEGYKNAYYQAVDLINRA